MRISVYVGIAMLGACFLTACTTAGIVGKEVDVQSTESVFVLGISPPGYSVGIWDGVVKDDVFLSNYEGFHLAKFLGPPRDGYIVGKAKAGEALGISLVQLRQIDSIWLIGEFLPCGGLKTMVFEIPSGQVIYLGNIAYEHDPSARRLRVSYSADESAARLYVKENFPNLADKMLVAQPYKLLPTNISCQKPATVIPIYVR